MVQNFTPLALTQDQIESTVHKGIAAKKVLLAVTVTTIAVFITLIVLLIQKNLSKKPDAGSLKVQHALSS